MLLAGIGAFTAGTFVFRLAQLIADVYVLPGKPVSKFGANKKDYTQATWAVITGATDGIGREFSLQLAKKGFNILLVSRSPEKLGSVAAEIEAASPGVRTKTQAIDFALGDERQYEGLEHTVKDLNVGVLVNNVGKSHSMPVTFAETTEEEMEDIVEINVVSILRVSRMIIPGMVSRKRGLVLNLGSFAGQVTTPMLATYAGSKAFLSAWSQALGEELRRSNITVSLLNTYFVVSNMSKVRKSSAMIPTPKQYVAQVLKTLGRNGGAIGRPYTSTPWPMHALVDWATAFVLPRAWLLSYSYGMFFFCPTKSAVLFICNHPLTIVISHPDPFTMTTQTSKLRFASGLSERPRKPSSQPDRPVRNKPPQFLRPSSRSTLVTSNFFSCLLYQSPFALNCQVRRNVFNQTLSFVLH